MRGLEPSPALNTEPGLFLQAFRRSHPERGWALHVFTVKHPRFPNGKLRNKKKNFKKIRAAASRFLQRACEAPQGSAFLGHFTISKHSSPPGAVHPQHFCSSQPGLVPLRCLNRLPLTSVTSKGPAETTSFPPSPQLTTSEGRLHAEQTRRLLFVHCGWHLCHFSRETHAHPPRARCS